MYTVYGDYFCGNKISEYGLQNHRVDYATLAKAFDAVLSNDLMAKTYDIGYWEQLSGGVDYDEIEELENKIDELQEELDELEEMEELDAKQEERKEELEKEIEKLEEEKEELEEYDPEIFQYYIVSDNGAEILQECNEIVFYNDELDLYIWGVTHYGTSWSYVLTDIVCNVKEEV